VDVAGAKFHGASEQGIELHGGHPSIGRSFQLL
jgi:hypothetical protein